MSKYKKRPIIVEAEIFKPGMEDGWKRCDSVTCQMYRNFGWECSSCPLGLATPYIETLEGIMCISEGDYIITGIMGERYPCKANIFEMTYELVKESEPEDCRLYPIVNCAIIPNNDNCKNCIWHKDE